MKVSRKKKGASIILVMAVTMTILIFSSVAISTAINTSKGNEIQIQEDDLFYIAESGFEHGYAKLMNEGSEVSYTKRLDDANVDIDITKESERVYRVRSEAKKGGKSKIVQGLIEDKRESAPEVRYSELISKYVVNSKALNIGVQGSVTIQYVNSKTEVIKNDKVQVAIFEQPNFNPEDKLFPIPELRLKRKNKITFNSMRELIDEGITNVGDIENSSIITEVHTIGGVPYNIVFINSDVVELNIPLGGEILQNIIILSSGDIKMNNNNNNALYANISIICEEMIISNEGYGSINMSPQPNIFYEEQKEALDLLISKYVEPRTPSTGGGSINDWKVQEMSY